MQKKSILRTCLIVLVMTVSLLGCAAMQKPSESNFKDPVVTLDYVDVAHYFGWWYYAPNVEPTKGEAGHNAAPLDYAFIFNLENPNSYPIMLESLKFACTLDGFEVNSGYSFEPMWIPAGKTNQLKVEVLFDPRGTMMSLGIVAGLELKEKGMDLWSALERIWTKAPDFDFPVGVIQGSAIFEAGGITRGVAFEGVYPK